MTIAIGTYLPPWGSDRARVPGYDEDALTMAVEAGRQALGDAGVATKVVFISRELPLLDGGNSGPLVAALRLSNDIEVVEQIGGAPAVLDALASAAPGTLVIGVDAGTAAGAAAALVTGSNPVTSVARVQRSFPQRTRYANGQSYYDDDPRMLREIGVRPSIEAAKLPGKPLVIAGLGAKDAAAWSAPGAPALLTQGASSVLLAIAALADAGRSGLVAASEQGAFSAANVDVAGSTVRRNERPVQAPAKRKATPGTGIKVSLAAYDRAFEAKVRWQAGKCTQCGTMITPPRYHCLECGADDSWELVPLPLTGTIYTTTTIHVPVPSLESPYSLAVVECDGTDVRSLMHVTDVPPGAAKIGGHGKLVLRRVAMRSGVPDYGHAFSPDLPAEGQSGGAK
jgi:uncharacterized protein